VAAPKVFVSSTCYDLSEIREQLNRFIISFGFDPVLSENGDVFFHPDLHTHDSCIHEVSNCQLFILIIGGRFGGEYVADCNKSITNAEYSAAKKQGIPVFTYVRKSVLGNHHIYQQNRKKDFASKIEYPSIDKQEFAVNIFDFIDDVRKSPINNSFEGFDNFQDIESHLRKQWAGMFFDFLKNREVNAQIDVTNHLIEGLSSSGRKLEELIKSFYLSSNAEDAEKSIKSIDIYSEVLKFFQKTITPNWLPLKDFYIETIGLDAKDLSNIPVEDKTWSEYLIDLGLFENDIDIQENEFIAIIRFVKNTKIVFTLNQNDKELTMLYENSIKKSTPEQRQKALEVIFDEHGIPF